MKSHRKRRGNSRYYVFFVMALFCIAIAGAGLYLFLINSKWLEITQISHSGNIVIPDSLITANLSAFKGQNLLGVSSSQVRSKFAKIHRVQQIKVHKRIPHSLIVTFQEREALLWIRSAEGTLTPIDENGMVLESFDGIAKEDIPIVGSYIPAAQLKAGARINKTNLSSILALHKRIIKEAPDFLQHISEYYMIDKTIHIVDSRYGTSIIPPQNQLADQLKRYLFVQENGNINRRSTVDLRFDKQVVIKDPNQ